MKNLVKGGADFLGSHLIDVLKTSGEEVICMDNCSTGTKGNIKHWLTNKRFLFLDNDVISPVELKVDRIWHLSCPASPKHYQKDPIETTRTIFLGTYNMLELVSKSSAKLLFASTSEVYGKPEVHPQKENYYGSVNPLVIRSCYNEAKRLAESLCMNYVRMRAAKVKVACIFNTYGSWMQIDDGRVISNFIYQALGKKRLTNYGDGSQSRSFCYVKDLINGLISLMDSNLVSPVNL